MTKFDIRVRRRQFTQSRIERHKNYQSLMDRHYEARKRKTRGVMVLMFLLILIITIVLAFINTNDDSKKKPQRDKAGDRTENVYQKESTNKETYKL